VKTCDPDIPDRDDPVESGPREPGEILFGTYSGFLVLAGEG
jgi:hypothetical protein